MASRHVVVPLLSLWVILLPAGCETSEPRDPGVPEPDLPAAFPEEEAGSERPAGSGATDFLPGEPFADETVPEPSALFRRVDEKARALASAPWSPPDTGLPRPLAEAGYDVYRSIRFRPERALWRGRTPFEIQLFHPGMAYDRPVAIHLVEGDTVRTLGFRADRFRYEGPASALENAARDLTGHAGFRVHYPMNDATSKDEVAVFLGASYFRLLGPGHVHGLSARGIAVDVGSPRGEEFPDFREFWLVRPGPGARSLVFFALLDGPSLTGAYRFELTPGEEAAPTSEGGGPGSAGTAPMSEGAEAGSREPLPTTVDVDARLYARRDVEKLGVAPLTSMFLFDPNNAASFDDFRNRVHDSHGLLSRTGDGEWIWRPLGNGPGLRVTSLRDRDPSGFGLVQRRRDFDEYLDLEARYHRRPSVWVAAGEGHWGTGGVELMEIPSASEFNDNVVAYWAPDAPFRAGEARWYRYTLETFGHRHPAEELAHVERTRIGWDALPGAADPPPRSRRRFVVDFALDETGGPVAPAPERDAGGTLPEAVLTTSAGDLADRRVEPLPAGGWRVSFAVLPDGDRPADMRLFLRRDGRVVSETWSYVWYPERAPTAGGEVGR